MKRLPPRSEKIFPTSVGVHHVRETTLLDLLPNGRGIFFFSPHCELNYFVWGSPMKDNRWYVITINEFYNNEHHVKELRTSTSPHMLHYDGPFSGVYYAGQQIEECEFLTREEAKAAVEESAPQYMP